MPSRNTIEIVINAQDNASKIIGGVINQTQKLGAISAAAIAGGVTAATAAVAGFSTAALREFGTFEAGLLAVASLIPDATEEMMQDMEIQVKSLAENMGILPNEILPSLYDAIGSGVPQDTVFDFLEVAAKAAVGNMTSVGAAVDGLTSVINAYGADVLDAQKASDIMFQTVNFGKTSFEDLSRSLYNVLPTAAALGVGFEDIGAAMSVMTSQGVPTSVVTTQLRQLFVELSKEGTKTSDIFKEIAGKSFKDFIAEGGNTQDALKLLEEYANDAGMGINDLFSSVEAGSAALSLTGKNAEFFAEMIGEMENAAGATDNAYEQMNKGIKRSLENLTASFRVTLLNWGKLIAPFVVPFIDAFTNIIRIINAALDSGETMSDWLTHLPQFMRPFGRAVAIFVTQVRNMILFFQEFIKQIEDGRKPLEAWIIAIADIFPDEIQARVYKITSLFLDFKNVLQSIVDPIVSFIAQHVKMQDVVIALSVAMASVLIPAIIGIGVAIAPLLVTFALLVGSVTVIRKAWESNFLGIRDISQKVLGFVGDKIEQISNLFKFQDNLAKIEGFDGIGDKITQKLNEEFRKIKVSGLGRVGETVLEAILRPFRRLSNALLPLFSELSTLLQPIIKDLFGNMDFSRIVDIGAKLLSLTSPLGIIKTLIETVFDVSIFDLFIGGINKLTEIIAGLNDGLSLGEALGLDQQTTDGINGFIEKLVNGFNNIVDLFQTTVLPALQQVGNWFITDGLPAVVDFVKGTFFPAIDLIGQVLGDLWGIVSPLIQPLADWFTKQALPAVVGFIQDVFLPTVQIIIDRLRGFWDAIKPGVEAFLNWVVNSGLPLVVNFFNNIIKPAVQTFIDILVGIWDAVSPALTNLFNWFMVEGLPRIQNIVENIVMPVFETFIDIIKTIWDVVQPALASLFDWFVTNGLPVIETAIDGVIGIWTTLKDLLVGLWNVVRDPLTRLGDGFKNIFQGVIDFFNNHIKPVFDGISSFVNDILVRLGLAQENQQNLQGSVHTGGAGARGLFGAPAANGMIVTQPTNVLAGEALRGAGDFEAVLNSDQIRSLLNEVASLQKPSVNIVIEGDTNRINAESKAVEIVDALRANGVNI